MMTSPREFDLLAFGDPVADIMLRADALPPVGGKTLGQSLGIWPGGTTANVACAAARLGLRSALFGRTGDDAYASLLRASLLGHAVDTRWLSSMAQTPSASAIAVLAPTGEKSIIYMPMPAAPVEAHGLAQALAQTRMMYAMPYDFDQFAGLCHQARQAGVRIAIDLEAAVAPDPGQMRRRAALADIVFFNEAGFLAGTGQPPTPDAMREVLALGPGEVVVTLGAEGAVAINHGGHARHVAFPATVRDTTGAGDSFNAAYLCARLAGQALPEALRFACAAASCTVAALGARGGLPDQQRVACVLQHGIRPKETSA
ncbi:carbohydrate kinase family protein [Herbaspirillum sp. alder98]|uniref:carbohydrate kinase family protein n=1 Tax=Herbaspirillum sp. alder98 TaxID=2913096 RepID=UPI001CD8EBBD|nr:carbohydrate kinase family protein [Herbaspirillum sp. alder98]MCA1325596.1 carbohydrate kinase family protein [Herbaspirillum sp. alder98]